MVCNDIYKSLFYVETYTHIEQVKSKHTLIYDNEGDNKSIVISQSS